MPRASRVPKYSLHKPSGRAVVKITLEGTRRSLYLGDYGSDESQENYARIIADLLAGRDITPPAASSKGNPTSVSRLAVGQLAQRFQQHANGYYRKNGKPTSEPAAIRCAMKFFSSYHANLPAAEFAIGDLKVVRQAMVDAGHCRSSINKNINRIRLAFTWAATEGLIPPAVAEALALLPGLKIGRTEARESKPVEPVETAVVKATIKHASDVVADMVRLHLLTGMRPDEVCSVRPCDIDRSSEVWEYTPERHKTQHHGRRRVIYIGPEGQRILTPYLLRPEEDYCFRPKRHIPVPRAKCRYRIDSYRRAIERACDRAFPAPEAMEGQQLKEWRKKHRWTPNRLRHTAATEIRRQFGLEASQVILGHSKADVTQIYAERDASKGREVAAKIG